MKSVETAVLKTIKTGNRAKACATIRSIVIVVATLSTYFGWVGSDSARDIISASPDIANQIVTAVSAIAVAGSSVWGILAAHYEHK